MQNKQYLLDNIQYQIDAINEKLAFIEAIVPLGTEV